MLHMKGESTDIVGSDRLVQGLGAGMFAGLIMSILDLILLARGWIEFAYYDWGLSLIKGTTAHNLFEMVVGQVTHILFSGMLGIVFAYAVVLVSSQNHLLKGWLYGIAVWFSVHFVVNLFAFDPLRPIPTSQVLSDFFTASVYGLVLSMALHRLSRK